MIFYCDKLTWAACRKAENLRRSLRLNNKLIDLRVLDPLPSKIKNTLMLHSLDRHFRIQEEQFIAGRLRSVDDQPVYIAARRLAHDTAFKAAQLFIEKSSKFNDFNRYWKRNTILLNLAEFFWTAVNEIIVRIFVAEALMRKAGRGDALLLIALPEYLDPTVFENCSATLKIEFYKERSIQQFYGMLWLLRENLRKLKWMVPIGGRDKFRMILPNDNEPSLLLLQEDEISSDRSYRTQPHWFDPAKPLQYRTLILKTFNDNREIKVSTEKSDEKIFSVHPSSWQFLPSKNKNQHPIERKLTKDLRCCLWTFKKSERMAMFTLIRLFYTARNLAFFCREKNVRAFMTCENYMPSADAMQLIAEPLNIRTISYQYSNMSHVGPHMLTTSDFMFTFSSMYHERWSYNDIRPGQFIDVGYVFDGSFKYIKERAKILRKRMMEKGCRFIICFFDENAFDGKYELVTKKDLVQEIQFLLTRLIEDSSLGLVIKNQFQWNAVQQFPEVAELRKRALLTGRYVELSVGTKRNIVFPAEAALVADVVIGHAVGATAPLEAALAGVRTILLNPYEMDSRNDFIYRQADIVYHSLEEIFDAIADFRAGKPERLALGDWNHIIDRFDPFRDGNAGQRTRDVLDKIMSEQMIPMAVVDNLPEGGAAADYC